MDIIQAILDGIAIAAIFNGTVAALILINPRFFFDSYPKAIQKATPEPMTKQEKKINGILTVIICWGLFSVFDSKPFTYRNYWFLECILDGIHSVEHIKLGRFFLVRLSVISGKI